MNTITIKLRDEHDMDVSLKHPIAFDDMLSVIMSLLLGTMKNLTKDHPEAKGAVYDMVNVAASKVLEVYAPEFELHPNLTAKAILEAENKIIEEGRLNEVEKGS